MSNPLEERFPDMRPIRSAPSLTRINGCGFCLVGSRDLDEETGTYVKTYCFSLLFIPVAAVSAYRVADAENRGWYMIGRVPLSGAARLWNWVLLACIIAGVGVGMWVHHTTTPEYMAGKKLAEADRLAAAGEPAKAAVLYKEVALGDTGHAGAAGEKFRTLFDGTVDTVPVRDAAAVCRVAAELRKRSVNVPTLFDRGLKRVQKETDGDPRGALMLLDVISPFAPKADEVLPTRQKVLERLVAQEPEDVEAAALLAVVYEAQGQLARCEALLRPHRDKLGTTEGARILGQIFVRQGKFEEAYALLDPYTKGRLEQFQNAEQGFIDALKAAETRILNEIRAGNAAGFPYDRFKAAGQEEKQAIGSEYVNSRLRDDPAVAAAREKIIEQGRVVPVALDFGLLLLRRAQGKADPAAREAELKRAEKTFLAVRNQAGQSGRFRLTLGEVYYWLGKPQQGRKLFDELLTAEKRNAEALLMVAHTLRGVGAQSEARPLMEEAFNKEPAGPKRHQAAHLRAITPVDLDDQITWLRRADTKSPETKATLAKALGQQALRDGKEAEAITHFKEAIDVYAHQPVETGTLNNGALVYLLLYQVTGDRSDFDKGLEMLEKAAALDPRDSILVLNAAGAILQAAVRDVVSPAVDVKVLKGGPSVELFGYLYQDQKGRNQLAERLRKHPGIVKTRAFLERGQLLAPKALRPYGTVLVLQAATRDREGVRGLVERLDKAAPDLSDINRQTLEEYQGKDEKKRLAEHKATLERAEEVLREARKGGRNVTFAVAATRVVGQRIGLAPFGETVNADKVVALAEEAHAAAPSQATTSSLQSALFFRASGALTAKEAAYAQFVSRAKRSLGPEQFIAVALWRPGKAREAALANGDVRRALALAKEANAKFPDDPSPRLWAMLRGADPAAADKLAEALKHDELGKLERIAWQKVIPLNATGALNACWALQAEGKEAEGLAILKECARRGVPLPFDR